MNNWEKDIWKTIQKTLKDEQPKNTNTKSKVFNIKTGKHE